MIRASETSVSFKAITAMIFAHLILGTSVFAQTTAGQSQESVQAPNSKKDSTPNSSSVSASNAALAAPALFNQGGWFGLFELRASQPFSNEYRDPQSLVGLQGGHSIGSGSLYVSGAVQYSHLFSEFENPEGDGLNSRFEDLSLSFGDSNAISGEALDLGADARGSYEFALILPTSDLSQRAGTRFGLAASAMIIKPIGKATLLISNDFYFYQQRFETANASGEASNEIGSQLLRARLGIPLMKRLSWVLDPRLVTSLRHSGQLISDYSILTGPNFEFAPTWMLSLRVIAQDRLYTTSGFMNAEHFSTRLSLIKWL